jgi:hypothetical protein
MGAAVLLSACGTVNYLRQEYGSQDPDMTIEKPDGGFWVFAHKTKPNLIVSVNPQRAAGMGMMQGFTYGAASGAPVYVEFDAAAKQYLDERKPGCRAVNGQDIEKVYREYEIECPPPSPVTAQANARGR